MKSKKERKKERKGKSELRRGLPLLMIITEISNKSPLFFFSFLFSLSFPYLLSISPCCFPSFLPSFLPSFFNALHTGL